MKAQTKQWIEKQFGFQAEIAETIQLDGGLSSDMYEVHFKKRASIVIRQIRNASWLEEEKDILLQEKHQLKQVADSQIPAPRFIAVDPYGENCGIPTLMMTKLPGHIQATIPINQMLEHLANCANMNHQTKINNQQYFYEAYMQIETLEIPQWTRYPAVWKALYDYIQQTDMPAYEVRFIHRDFHLNNMLWDKGTISGVVDWINSCMGPKYIDIAHCRWNLAMTHSVQEADIFLQKYEELQSGGDSYQIYWDIRALFDIDPASISVYDAWHYLSIPP